MTWITISLILLAIIVLFLFAFRSKRASDAYLENLKGKIKETEKQKPTKAAEPANKKAQPSVSAQKPIKKKVKEEIKAPTKPEPIVEEKPQVILPKRDYPHFDNARAVEQLGLSQEEADMFITELIELIDTELSGLETAVHNEEYDIIENISHMIKGSATSLGSGGVADVLVDFNTYVKDEEPNIKVIHAHLDNLKHYLDELKKQFG